MPKEIGLSKKLGLQYEGRKEGRKEKLTRVDKNIATGFHI
jgi:hypothetical protein